MRVFSRPRYRSVPSWTAVIRHGIASRSEKGCVEIGGRKLGDRLWLSVRDDGPGLPQGWDIERSSGIGIRNTRERLRCLYGAGHTFRIGGEAGLGVAVEIEIPFREADDRGRAVE